MREPPSNHRSTPTRAMKPAGAQVGDVFIYVLHNAAELDLDPVAAGFQVVVSGHSHQPSVEERNGVLYVNPGSSGPRRFKLPIAVAELEVAGHSVKASWRCLR